MLLAAACAHGPTARHAGHAPWLGVSSPHFSLRGDLRDSELREIAGELEAIEAGAYALDGVARPADGPPLAVVVFANDGERAEFTAGGPTLGSDALGRPLLVLSGSRHPLDDAPLKHWLAHRADERAFPRLPRWTAEALAASVEAIRLGPNGLVLNGVNQARTRSVWRRMDRKLAMLRLGDDEVLALGPLERESYTSHAWFFGQWLLTTEPDRYAEFRRLLAAGELADQAWDKAFDGAPFEEVLARVPMLAGRSPAAPALQAALPQAAMETRPLAPSEVHALRAAVARLGSNETVVEAELQQAGDEPEAVILRNDLPALREALLAEPRNALLWTALGRLARGAEEREAALKVAASLDPASGAPLEALASAQLRARSPAASGLARKAADLSPDARTLGLLARALCDAGDTERASRALDAALSRARDESSGLARDLKRAMPSSCRAAPPAQPDGPLWRPGPGPAPTAECAAVRPGAPPGARGLVLADYVINGEGRVESVQLVGEPRLANEVQAFLSACRFEPPEAALRVTQPFVFGGGRP